MSELLVGIDEVGRGPLAGPVVAAAVILREPVEGLADSKTLSAARRLVLAAAIRENAWIGIGAASVPEIERINILQATFLAMRRALARLPVQATRCVIDGNKAPPLGLPTECVVGGDAIVPAISAASIVAKVTRDRLMHRLALRHPGYGFERNVGYGTREHLDALGRLGPTGHHRRGFAPVARLCLAAGA
ncbi:ribonuclease HII [Geminicoccaceae bacterium 1502E]|nr:ribonuclease HII [Geminicoccaceae bacterium 1502E]